MNNIYVKLAKTNIRNNKPLYLPYIFSGVMTVAMFYMMMFLNGNDGISKIPGAQVAGKENGGLPPTRRIAAALLPYWGSSAPKAGSSSVSPLPTPRRWSIPPLL